MTRSGLIGRWACPRRASPAEGREPEAWLWCLKGMVRLSLTLVCLSILVWGVLPSEAQQTQEAGTTTFVWLNVGTLKVPRGFKEETRNYTEGTVTRLCYSDGSCFVLQRGGMYRVPMFQDPEHIVDFSKDSPERTIRRGHYKGKSEMWGEINYKHLFGLESWIRARSA